MRITHNGRAIEIYHCDAMRLMHDRMGTPFGSVIADPPYASGGSTLASKQQGTSRKYTSTKGYSLMPDFEGDAMDQRSWMVWMTDVLRDARRLCVPGAPLCVFTDWRQLPALTDAVQRAGWIWRGVVVWDKRNCRPQRGRFRQQAEFIAWASNGPMPTQRGVDVLPGVLSYTPSFTARRYHQTEKPLGLMRQVVRITSPGGVVFDPFMGSGTTLLAAALEGYDSVGCELSREIYDTACARLMEE